MKKLKAESVIQKDMVDLLRRRCAYVFKVIRANEKGISDLICCYKGFFVAIEVKAEGKGWDDASPLQKLQIQRVRTAGGIGEVCSSIEEVERILDKLDNVMIL